MEEDEAKAERTQFPEVCSEHTPFFNKDKRVYARMAELLWNCRYEEKGRRTELLAISQDTHVYMETMEESKDKSKKSIKDGSTGRLGPQSWKQSQRILVCNTYGCNKFNNDKRKTDKQWFL